MIAAEEAKNIAYKVLESESSNILKKIEDLVRTAANRGEFYVNITGIILPASVKEELTSKGFEIKVDRDGRYILNQELCWR